MLAVTRSVGQGIIFACADSEIIAMIEVETIRRGISSVVRVEIPAIAQTYFADLNQDGLYEVADEIKIKIADFPDIGVRIAIVCPRSILVNRSETWRR